MKQFTILKKLISFFGVLFFIFSPSLASAQGFCGTNQAMQDLYEKYPGLKEEQKKLVESSKQFVIENNGRSRSVVYTIPVVFHILHEYGSENLHDTIIKAQIARLNKDFRKLNEDTANVVPEFKGLIADSRVEFKLATKDYQGNCTNGIERIFTHETQIGDDFSKLNPWPREKYLNIWVSANISRPGVAGYATFPSGAVGGYMYFLDGIMVTKDYVGESHRVLTHEVGHYLGLSHPWGDGEIGTGCGNDGILDTPPTKGWSFCSLNDATSCPAVNIAKAYSFSSVTTGSGVTDPTPVVADSGIVFSSFSASGVSNNSFVDTSFSFTNWETGSTDGETDYNLLTGSLNTSKYYEITITPKLGYNMSISKIDFNFYRTQTGVRTFAVRSSVDNFADNLAASADTSKYTIVSPNIFFIKNDTSYMDKSTINLDGVTNYVKRTSPIKFRFYGWNAEDVLGTFGIDNVTITLGNGKVENIQNYMEYAYCSKMFTIGQAEAMEATLNNSTASRDNLSKATNLAQTGTDVTTMPVCIPVADFNVSNKFICAGSAITFNNATWRAEGTYSWTFTDGTPATSTEANPTVTFNTHGWKTVSLTATNAAGSHTTTMENFIYVSGAWTEFQGTHVDNFQSENWWLVDNIGKDQVQWELVNIGVSGASKAYGLRNAIANAPQFGYYERVGGKRDALISPSYDLSLMTSGNLSFTYSAATRSPSAAGITERLVVYFSTDCGKTWGAPRRTITGVELISAGVVDGPYVPTQANQWRTATVSIPAFFHQGNVRFKFEYTASDGSNNIYINNFTIDGVVGIEEKMKNEYFSLNIFPNPSRDDQNLNVSYLSKGNEVKLSITDLVGKLVYSINENNGPGENTTIVNMSETNMKAGVYFLNISDGVYNQTKKVVVY
ncbi:MAG: T9SS type A sorting domain-containing protein [Bacteroidetes bacterium]|nr:T9SS type A sorting domain-containing protein [Bacteroidota bacterium]HET6243985.1 M43 family zinc metalloprotease [Bacteroidia bacterium]